MNPKAWVSALAACGVSMGCATSSRFSDDFRGSLGRGWTILREDASQWRTTREGLQIRIVAGNMWGPANNARNTFVRPAPDPSLRPVEVSVRFENRPTEQYEQVDLVWYYADSHQVKIGQELVDGKLSIVMGREEGDRTRTIAIIPLDSPVVDVRFQVSGNQIRGAFRTPAMADWKEAGSCDLPVLGSPKISLQAYQGPTAIERWVTISQFRVR
ncbi:MAG: hypothetical protein JNK85_03095 [Verrucomicrobiales bacterium]|nr:hypothetical protein [Verrucomicrobiales bacterium]